MRSGAGSVGRAYPPRATRPGSSPIRADDTNPVVALLRRGARARRTGSSRTASYYAYPMAYSLAPSGPHTGLRGMVNAADHLAATAGIGLLQQGGSAADAAVGAAAVMAVTSPHLCGMGGDLLAMVFPPGGEPVSLSAIGRAGSGVDADRLRAEGHRVMPLRRDLRAVPVPGAVDGWLALHARWGRLPLGAVIAPALELAEEGFVAMWRAPRNCVPMDPLTSKSTCACRRWPAPCEPSSAKGVRASTRGSSGRR